MDQTSFRVGFVLLDDFALMAYASASEPLRAANLLAGRRLYDVRNLPGSGARAVSSGGAEVRATAFVGEQVDFDLVLVVAGGDPVERPSPRLDRWLRHLASRGTTIGGVSAGPYVLARAGVMRGRRMTVHWEHIEPLEALKPGILLERSRYVIDRDRVTCGGGTAALDMMHALISRHHGATFARRVTDWFLHVDVRPYDAPQRAGLASRYGTRNRILLTTLELMENHLADPLDLDQLARLSGVGSRHLNRLFRQHLQRSTLELYRDIRLDKATTLLTRTGLSLSEIAAATGFATAAHFSKGYRRRYGLSPSARRREGQPSNQSSKPDVPA